jgi:uncharacterized protein (UPF0297 family)
MQLSIIESYNKDARKQIDESVYSGDNKSDLAEVLLAIYNSEDQDGYETYAKYHDSGLIDELLANEYITTEQGTVGQDFLTLTDKGYAVVEKIESLF